MSEISKENQSEFFGKELSDQDLEGNFNDRELESLSMEETRLLLDRAKKELAEVQGELSRFKKSNEYALSRGNTLMDFNEQEYIDQITDLKNHIADLEQRQAYLELDQATINLNAELLFKGRNDTLYKPEIH